MVNICCFARLSLGPLLLVTVPWFSLRSHLFPSLGTHDWGSCCHPWLRGNTRFQLGHSESHLPQATVLVQGWACDLSQANENHLDEILGIWLEQLGKRCFPASEVAEDRNWSFGGHLPWGSEPTWELDNCKASELESEKRKAGLWLHHLSPGSSFALPLQLHEQKVLFF